MDGDGLEEILDLQKIASSPKFSNSGNSITTTN